MKYQDEGTETGAVIDRKNKTYGNRFTKAKAEEKAEESGVEEK